MKATQALVVDGWFSTLGESLGAGERADIAAYCVGLGLATTSEPLVVTSWDDAARYVKKPAGDWWQREEAERARFEQTIQLDPADPEWIKLNDVLHGGAAVAASRFSFANAGMIKVAAGAASFAAYHEMLAGAAHAPAAHPFHRKYALFAAGRWPLGVYDRQFVIF